MPAHYFRFRVARRSVLASFALHLSAVLVLAALLQPAGFGPKRPLKLEVSMAEPLAEPESARWQFSLRAMFLLTLSAAALAALGRVAPQLDVLVVGLAAAVWSTFGAVRAWRQRRRISGAAGAVLSLSWCAFYTVSVGPAVVIALRYEWMATILDRVYAPLEWLYFHTPLHDALDWYLQFWQQLA